MLLTPASVIVLLGPGIGYILLRAALAGRGVTGN